MDKQKLKHILGLLGTIAIPLLTVWGDASTALAVKVAVTVSLLIPLVWSNPAEQARVTTALLAGIPVATIVVSAIASRMSGSAAAGATVTVLLAVLTQLPKVLAARATAVPLPGSTPTPVTVANPTGGQAAARAKDGGSALVTGLAVAALLGLALSLVVLLMPRPARAEEPGRWSYGPSAAAAVAAIDLRTGDYLAGAQAVALGPCFGVTFVPWQLGGDLCANVQVGKAEPNRYGGSIMGHWRRYFDGGLGAFFVQGDGWRLLALIGARAPFLQGGAAR